MIIEKMSQNSQDPEKYSDKKSENDQKWCIFVTKRAQTMGTKLEALKVIREDLKKTMNPFSQELIIEVSTRLDPEAKIKDEYGCEIPASSVIEKADSVKVYQSAANRDRAMNMSATAMRMFVFIVYELEDTDDWVELDPEWYKQISGAGSRNMYKKGKEELVRYGYITPTEHKNIYWVNPSLMFAGNRIRKYPTKVLYKNVYTGKPQPKSQPGKKAFSGFGKQNEQQEKEQMEKEFRQSKTQTV